MPEKTTQDFEGPGMVSKVDNVLGMHLHATDDNEEVNIANDSNNGLANPYMQYPGGNANEPVEEVKPKKKKSSSGSGERERGSGTSRPKSAARKSGNREEK